MPAQQSEMRGLTGLRGVAALLVVSVHAFDLDPPGNAAETFLFQSYLWVDLFLALSGFVLSSRYEAAFRRAPIWPMTADFLLRRLARLWPLLAFTTLLTLGTRQLGWTWLSDPLQPWMATLVVNLLMLTAWTGQATINVPAWSVSAEWACCLLFPLLQAILFGRRLWPVFAAMAAAILALCVLASSYLAMPFRRGTLDIALSPAALPVVRCLSSFVLGMVMWRLAQLAPVRRIAEWRIVELGLGVAILLLMTHRGTDLIVVLLFPPFVLCISRQTGLFARLLASRLAHGLGVISYSVYLMQLPLLMLRAQSMLSQHIRNALAPLGLPQDQIGQQAVFCVLLLAVSTMTWWLIEVPARRALTHCAQRLTQRWSSKLRGLPAADRSAIGL